MARKDLCWECGGKLETMRDPSDPAFDPECDYARHSHPDCIRSLLEQRTELVKQARIARTCRHPSFSELFVGTPQCDVCGWLKEWTPENQARADALGEAVERTQAQVYENIFNAGFSTELKDSIVPFIFPYKR